MLQRALLVLLSLVWMGAAQADNELFLDCGEELAEASLPATIARERVAASADLEILHQFRDETLATIDLNLFEEEPAVVFTLEMDKAVIRSKSSYTLFAHEVGDPTVQAVITEEAGTLNIAINDFVDALYQVTTYS